MDPAGKLRYAITGRKVYPERKRLVDDQEKAKKADKDAEASINRFVFDGQTFTAGKTWDPTKEPETPKSKETTPTKTHPFFNKSPKSA